MNFTTLIKKYKVRFIFNLLLILLEAGLALLFPLLIGHAIDDALNSSYNGVIGLGLLGFSALIVGVGRRIFDSRFYAKIYQEIGPKVIANQKEQNTSKKAARLGMMKELIEFLEFSFPELIHAIISLVGVIVFIAALNINVFWGTVISSFLIGLIYKISRRNTFHFNKEANDEQEKQVTIVAKKDEAELKQHLKKMMHWNVKLSDLEAFNFSFSWLILMVFLVVSIIVAADGSVKYGVLLSLMMYVFQYIENIINLPFFYQNWLRLKDIKKRLFMA